MFKSVATKLWLIIFALVVGILFVFSLFLTNRLETIYFTHQVKLMREHALQWRDVIDTMPPDKVQQELEFWGGVSHYNLAVFNEKGIVVFSSDTKHSPIGQKSSWTHIEAGIENRESYFTGFNPDLNMEMTATFLPFTNEKTEKYLIMIHAPTIDLMEMIKVTRTMSIWVLFLFFILSGALILYFSRLIAKPLIKIRQTAINMAKGDFTTLLNTDRNDELGDLAKTMNILSIRLKKSLGSLTRANEELNDLLKKWKEFVADVSHELRTPLFLIQGYSEAILDNVVKDEPSRSEYLTVINKESLRLQKLVNDLLAVEGGLPLQKAYIDLYNLARESVTPFEIIAGEKKVTIKISKTLKQIGLINVDPDKLGEVIYNLVDNALRHTAENGRIEISGSAQGPEKIQLIITDTGTGIPTKHLPFLFNRFYRVDKARSRARGGSGLGLAIVKKIVEQHAGEITVKSMPDKGTTFIITLPMR